MSTPLERKECKHCGEPVIAPHDLGYHLSCKAEEVASLDCEIDTKDMCFLSPDTTFTPKRVDDKIE